MAGITPGKIFSAAADAVYLSSRPLPTAPTGYYDWQVSSHPAAKLEGHSTATNVVNRITTVRQQGVFKPDLALADAFLDAFTKPESIDDRKGLFSSGFGMLARMNPNTGLAKKMNNAVIDTLYNTITHPPASYLGDASIFRQADGGNNGLHNPDIGRAGTPYARSVQGRAGLPPTSLPDPGLIFDTILKKRDHQNHTGGMSSMIFAFASIVTHSLFRTDTKDMNINNASSYLDLSPLYGDNQAAQDKVRDKSAGRGLLYPDTFSEERLLFAPPATSALLVIFSRNHNYIARRLLKINEKKKWSDPVPTDNSARALQDEQIFQTARLINCGHFISTILGDYVAGFLGLSEGCNWNMNAFDVIDSKDRQVDRGLGNHVSAEFNILYRWHATMSETDQKWTEEVFRECFGNKPFHEISMSDVGLIHKKFSKLESNPSKRVFSGLKRQENGMFNDDDIANILQNATESSAGAFRGRGTPEVLRIAEIMGIEQSRSWGLCTMNEFRNFLGLKQFETFEEWNPDPEIAGAARRLYGHVDNLELYTGLQAESTMPLSDGSRFVCGFTTTRGVLGDAIALIRGDRHFTTDFTPAHLTAWGFHDCQRDMDNGGFGGNLPKLLIRHLPRHYPYNSVYSLFPFFTPSKMKASLKKQGIDDKYTFDRPAPRPHPKILNTFTGIKYSFNDPARFKIIYEKVGYGSVLMFDDVPKHDEDKKMVLHAFFHDKNTLDEYSAWYRDSTASKIKEKSWKHSGAPGTYVDIVKDVINIVAVTFVAEKLFGITLKTKETPSGLYTEQEFVDMLQSLFADTCLSFDDPEHAFSLRQAALEAGTIIGALTGKAILEVPKVVTPGLIGHFVTKTAAQKPSHPFLSRMVAAGRPTSEILGCILGLGVGASVNYAQSATQVVDFYLDEAREKERNHIIQLVNNKDDASLELLRGYVREGMRLRPQFTGLWRQASVDAEIPQGPGLPPMKVHAGDFIRGSFKNAHIDPAEFPDPQKVDPSRPANSYNLNGAGFHNCPGTTFAVQTIAEIVRSVFALKNIRRAAGHAGRLNGFNEIVEETETTFYIQRNGSVDAWPSSLHVVYDD